MKIIRRVLFVIALASAPCTSWSANDYSLEYATIDIAGGPVSETSESEDLITGEVQGVTEAKSQNYTVASVLQWPNPITAVTDWTLYQ